MIYLLKFGAAWVLPPGLFIVALAVIGWLLWRRGERRIAKVILVLNLMFYILCMPLMAERLVGVLERQYEFDGNLQGDVVIMLGGGATGDTVDIDGLGHLGSHAAGRLLTAARVQKALDIPILVSGGQVFSDSGAEAQIARRQLRGLGVPDSKIIIEDKSLNTKQNALFTAQLLSEYGLQEPVLVTSAFHMPRSVLNFQKAGMVVQPLPTDYMTGKRQDFYFNKLAPSAGAFDGSIMVLREFLALFVAKYIW